jgi:hypothetical protein
MKTCIKSWEVVLIIIGLFVIFSASLYWYDYFNKNKKHSIEMEMRAKWEQDTLKWQKDVTNNINVSRQFQQQVFDVINFNILNGRLIVPKEKK